MRRALRLAPRVPDEAMALWMALAALAHDRDVLPCCWASPETLTVLLFEVDTRATRERYKRRVKMLEDAELIARARKPHHPRPRSRTCPRDARKFHVELSALEHATRALLSAELSDGAGDQQDTEIGNAGRSLLLGDRARPASEIGHAPRALLKEYPKEYPPERESPGGSDPSERESLSVVASGGSFHTSPSVGAHSSNGTDLGIQDQKRLEEVNGALCLSDEEKSFAVALLEDDRPLSFVRNAIIRDREVRAQRRAS